MAAVNGEESVQSGITGIQQLERRAPELSFQPYGQTDMKAPSMHVLAPPIFSYSSDVLMQVDGHSRFTC